MHNILEESSLAIIDSKYQKKIDKQTTIFIQTGRVHRSKSLYIRIR
jgi:hypothetical protein